MGFKVVPILDPGVKKESGFAVYESGHKAGVFCKNPAGTEFTGIVLAGLYGVSRFLPGEDPGLVGGTGLAEGSPSWAPTGLGWT